MHVQRNTYKQNNSGLIMTYLNVMSVLDKKQYKVFSKCIHTVRSNLLLMCCDIFPIELV